MENHNGLIVGAVTTRASGHAERLAVLALIEPHAGGGRATVSIARGQMDNLIKCQETQFASDRTRRCLPLADRMWLISG